MQYRKIANTDLEVSSICLGSWVFGGDACWGKSNDADSVHVVKEAIKKGINFIDTAPVYGNGHAEEIIGRALEGKFKDIIIATKCGLEQKGSSIGVNLSAPFIREEIENSLSRLKIERIDLYQCHWPDPNTPLEETFGELNNLVKEGKIRYIGVCNFSRELLEQARQLSRIVSNQVQYSLLDREAEKDFIPFYKEEGISVLSYGPLGGGILTGKYKKAPTFPKGDARTFFYKYYKEPFWSKAKELVSTLNVIAKKHKVPISQVAIDWVLSHEQVASCIVGCRTEEQLMENVRATEWSLGEEELIEIDRFLDHASRGALARNDSDGCHPEPA